MFRPRDLILLLLLFSSPWMWGSGDDCANGPAGALVHQSAFAHGYLHGYEAGFHAADGDLHLARVRSLRERREIARPSGYSSEFGARDSFRGGFHEGFLAGYDDSIQGRDFRAFELLAVSPEALAGRPQDFDHGFEDGYKAGQKLGAGDLEADGDFDPQRAVCPARRDQDGSLPASSEAYCSGYLRAYHLGYTDGYVLASPAGPAVVAAR